MSKVDFHWKNNVNTLLIWIISLSLQHQTESSLRLCRIKKGKELARFLVVHLIRLYILLFISNQSITFTPITFMRRFAIFALPKTSVSTAPRKMRYCINIPPTPEQEVFIGKLMEFAKSGECHNLGTSTSEWERGKGKDAYCNRLRAQDELRFTHDWWKCLLQII